MQPDFAVAESGEAIWANFVLPVDGSLSLTWDVSKLAPLRNPWGHRTILAQGLSGSEQRWKILSLKYSGSR